MTYEALGEMAKQAIIAVLQEGEKKYPANDFMYRPMKEHAEHGSKHLRNFCFNFNEEELTHALTRVAIMLAKIRNDENG